MPQLSLNLSVADPFSLQFFVPHSGVSEAIEVLEQSLNDLCADDKAFRILFLYGASGTGKSHLLQGYLEKAKALGIAPQKLHIFRTGDLNSDDEVRAFIDCVERARSKGGLVGIEGAALPSEGGALEPHVRSRLLSGYSVRVCYPQEVELRPLVLALLERRSLRLPEHSIEHLMRWLPANPLSFERIIRSIDELSLGEQRRISRGVLAEVLKGSAGT